MDRYKEAVFGWVDQPHGRPVGWNQTIWHYGETALREYKSSAWYVARLKDEGFEVEAGTGGMPTAFRATWSNGAGPRIAAYAEYDAVPGNCQAAATKKMPRAGLSPHAGGHTDPHSALGISALGGALAAKAVMTELGLKGTIVFSANRRRSCGCRSRCMRPRAITTSSMPRSASTRPTCCRWSIRRAGIPIAAPAMPASTPSNAPSRRRWLSGDPDSPIPASHVSARAPGATDALFHMFSLTKQTQSNMLPFTQGWSLSEAILTAGQATADNLPAQIAEIQYLWRTPTIEMAQQVARVLDNNAEAAAKAAHCTWKKTWVTQSRPGLPNHALAEATYRNIVLAGAPQWDGEAIRLAQEIQKELGLTPMDKPYLGACETTIPPMEAEMKLRHDLPPSQLNSTSDDYTEFCWHCPTVRFYIARPMLKAPKGFSYPAWAMNALGGLQPCIDPMIRTAAKTIGATITDLMSNAELLQQCAGRVEATAPAAASAARTGSHRCCPRISACRSTSAGRNT